MHMLQTLLTGGSPNASEALANLWASLPGDPGICWYPSAGNCFRDLLIWRHYPQLRELPAPRLFIHTDYIAGLPDQPEYRDRHTCIRIEERHSLKTSEPIHYRVDPAFASLAGLAPEQLEIELLDVHVQSDTAGEFRQPVLYFHMENFNWFEELVLNRGLRFSHLFKLREGCGFGGARTSVSNLYPFLAQAGCQWLIADQEIHLDQHLIRRWTRRHAADEIRPWQITSSLALGELSGMNTLAHRIEYDVDASDWLTMNLQSITCGSNWEINPAFNPRARDAATSILPGRR